MDLTSLRYFVALARNLHFTKTAQELYISQQNLSQHINKLETHYRTPLFYRKPKLQLTPAGKALYDSCIKILTEEDNISRQMNDIIQNNVVLFPSEQASTAASTGFRSFFLTI